MYVLEMLKLYSEILSELSKRGFFLKNNIINSLISQDDYEIIFQDIYQALMKSPQYWQSYCQQYSHLILNMNTPSKSFSVDRRFSTEDWNNGMYKYYRQLYELNSDFLTKVVDNADLEPKMAKKLRFILKLVIEASSPSNIPYTNPEVIKTYYATNGQSLVRGLYNFLQDIKNSNRYFAITTNDNETFKLGENIATTEGAVIFENDIMQLIQYKPIDAENHIVPILIIPPWINKFYIFDLNSTNSLVRWLLDKQYSVFIISWINPDLSLANKSFSDYMNDGIISAINSIVKVTGQEQVNTIGYCISGTLLAACIAYLQAKNIDRVKSATFLTTLIDFTSVGDFDVFIDEKYIEYIEQNMSRVGFLDSDEMKNTFSILRTNETIWYFVINNYLLGKKCAAFDLLYWNSDGIRLPAALHSFYLRNMYLNNLLVKPGGLVIDNIPIDVSKINIPVCFVAAKNDHIVPWQSCYKGFTVITAATTKKFILTASGHVAGIVNHPNINKYCYWSNDATANSADEWMSGAQQCEGSWWNNWHQWNLQFAGPLVQAPPIIAEQVIERAPGRYVRQK